ncbi:receptor-like protein EIX2 [Dioscorea cayenensis subsp. rotundata]|uniref:Receptor-like protein EIX2 n=1 Tax=Dioscorea cayennensis subsp. rotundata TaxID=55577 RepID=A0AB40CF47_DIOCR|nr:receptor-like protein EIX2 [Dioscorea cayenensis subsp. rotundata]
MAGLSLSVLFVILVVSAFPPACYVHGISCIETERIALLSIKAGIQRSNNQSLFFSSWIGYDCCNWKGVSCNHESWHVIKLDLHHYPSNITYNYEIPPSKLNSSLIQLHHLKHLDLSMNNFKGFPIPDFIGSLANLEYLNLSFTGFSGIIPHTLGNLTSLRYLDLSSYYNYQFLQANDLHWLSGMTSLHHLDLSGVDLSNVHGWLHQINMLPSLLVLRLPYARLQDGGINHDTIFSHLNLTSLYLLDLSHNFDLNITLPQWLFNLTSLVYLDLSHNQIHGSIPETIVNLVHLQVLDLSETIMFGKLPESIGNLRRLQHLRMQKSGIIGRLPESLGKLHSLRELDLSRNNISGTLPKSIGNLCKLRTLDLTSNFFNGGVDDLLNGLSNCTENKKSIRHGSISEDMDGLIQLSLGSNRFNGTIPDSLGKLSKLRTLDLPANSFIGTLTEHHFANLTDLSYMDFSYNLLQLNVPKDWVPPFDANGIMLCSCRIGTAFPAWLKTQTHLNDICLSDAGISGNVPTWFWDLSYLSSLNISHNNLSGTLPPSIEGLFTIDLSSNKFEGLIPKIEVDFLDAIDLSNNSISGPIPSFFSLAESIEVFSLANNHISGSIPLFFCNLTSLVLLDLSNNNMSGGLPQCGRQTSSLAILDLSNNNLMGSIPNGIVSLPSLRSLHLERNGFSGNLPLSLKNANQLVVLDIGENKLSGIIPSWIGSLVSLVVLRLRSNLFKGSIPEQLLKLSSLKVLDLAQNNLSGAIFPHSFGGFKAMHTERSQLLIPKYDQVGIFNNASFFGGFLPTYNYLESLVISAKGRQTEYTKVLFLVTSIDLSCNRLSGEFPDELTSLHGLIFLNLSNNLLNGKLPKNIGDMNQLESLDLSINNFSGIIPPSISALNFLGHLNLSHNNLSGKIPSGNQLQTLDASAFFYNDGLCGFPLSDCTSETPAQGPLHGGNQDGNQDLFDNLWFYIGLASGFIVGFWMIILFIMMKKSRRISYFRSIDKVYDWIYVKLVIHSRRLKSILRKRN